MFDELTNQRPDDIRRYLRDALTEAQVPGRRILVIGTESDMRDLLSYNFQLNGYEVRTADTGKLGLEAFESFTPNVVLLDFRLPDIRGTEIWREIRCKTDAAQPTIIILTARGEVIERADGIEVGANDCVVAKPFSVPGLLLRVNAAFGGRGDASDPYPSPRAPKLRSTSRPRKRYTAGPLRVDTDGHHVFVEQAEIYVSALEMRLLAYLLEHRGRLRSREDLLADVWGDRPNASTRTVDTHVKRLRDKLGTPGAFIETVRGIGYRFADPSKARSR